MEQTTRPLLAAPTGVEAPVAMLLHELGGGRNRCPVTSLTHVESDGLLRDGPGPT